MLLLYYGRFFFNVQNPTSMISTALNGRHDVEKKPWFPRGSPLIRTGDGMIAPRSPVQFFHTLDIIIIYYP
jgi:hypothetical protein